MGKKKLNPVQKQIVATADWHRTTVDGTAIQVYRWGNSESQDNPKVLLAHGWASSAGRLAAWVEPLLEAGFDVVAMDGPAHGESDGKSANLPSYVATLKAIANDNGQIHGIIGHSFGGLCASMAVAGELIVETPNLPVSHLVLIASPNSSKEVIGRFGQFMGMSKRVVLRVYRRIEEMAGHPIESYSVSNVIRGTDAAVLVVHDREDLDVPVADAEAIAVANPAVDLQITNGLGHHRIARHADVIDRVIAFLKTRDSRVNEGESP